MKIFGFAFEILVFSHKTLALPARTFGLYHEEP